MKTQALTRALGVAAVAVVALAPMASAHAATVPVGDTASQDDVDSANTLATVGLVVGVLALALGVVALVRSRRTPAGTVAPGETEEKTPAGTSST